MSVATHQHITFLAHRSPLSSPHSAVSLKNRLPHHTVGSLLKSHLKNDRHQLKSQTNKWLNNDWSLWLVNNHMQTKTSAKGSY